MPKVKSETIGHDAFPNKKHVFTYFFDADKGGGSFHANLPDWMAAALGISKTEPRPTLAAAEKDLLQAISDFAAVEVKKDLVIACQYRDKPNHFDHQGLMISVRARLMIRTTKTFRGGQKISFDDYRFRPTEWGFEEERWKAWRVLDPANFWNVERDENVRILEHTEELEAYFLRVAEALRTALEAIFATPEAIAATAAQSASLAAGFELMPPAPPAAPEPAKKWTTEVFARAECTFHYCPHPELCQEACRP